MTEEPTMSVERAADLVQRGPQPTPPSRNPRALLRRGVLRVLRPYTHHQGEVDSEIVEALERQEAELKQVAKRHSEQIERLEDLARELILTAESVRKATSDAELRADVSAESAARAVASIEPIEAELSAEPYMAGNPFESFNASVGEVLGFRSLPAAVKGDAGYVAFEDLFRGPAERVVESQRLYLDLVRGHEPVLDVGCGRGEFLALLAVQGIAARGVDSDLGMVERCRLLGVKVEQGNANEYLEGLADGTLGTIFSAQVIEHIPYEELRRMFDLALLKLRPGGLFIAETVNPHRISSLKTFWVDLTHQHPIFPEVALAMCAIAGFESAYVFAPGFDSYERARYQSPSYAIVATVRPPEDASS